jgi:hypothetical protein
MNGKGCERKGCKLKTLPAIHSRHKKITKIGMEPEYKFENFSFSTNFKLKYGNRATYSKWYQHIDRKDKTIKKLTVGDNIIS